MILVGITMAYVKVPCGKNSTPINETISINSDYSLTTSVLYETKRDSLSDLTLSRRRPLSNRNQFIDLRSKSMDQFLYDNGLRHERVNQILCI